MIAASLSICCLAMLCESYVLLIVSRVVCICRPSEAEPATESLPVLADVEGEGGEQQVGNAEDEDDSFDREDEDEEDGENGEDADGMMTVLVDDIMDLISELPAEEALAFVAEASGLVIDVDSQYDDAELNKLLDNMTETERAEFLDDIMKSSCGQGNPNSIKFVAISVRQVCCTCEFCYCFVCGSHIGAQMFDNYSVLVSAHYHVIGATSSGSNGAVKTLPTILPTSLAAALAQLDDHPPSPADLAMVEEHVQDGSTVVQLRQEALETNVVHDDGSAAASKGHAKMKAKGKEAKKQAAIKDAVDTSVRKDAPEQLKKIKVKVKAQTSERLARVQDKSAPQKKVSKATQEVQEVLTSEGEWEEGEHGEEESDFEPDAELQLEDVEALEFERDSSAKDSAKTTIFIKPKSKANASNKDVSKPKSKAKASAALNVETSVSAKPKGKAKASSNVKGKAEASSKVKAKAKSSPRPEATVSATMTAKTKAKATAKKKPLEKKPLEEKPLEEKHQGKKRKSQGSTSSENVGSTGAEENVDVYHGLKYLEVRGKFLETHSEAEWMNSDVRRAAIEAMPAPEVRQRRLLKWRPDLQV